MFAHTIQGRLPRADDFAVRRGGEEIAVVLPGLDASHALAPAETMLPAVRGLAAVCTFAQHRAPVRPPVPIGGFDGWAGTAALPLYAAKRKWDGCRGDVLRSPATARSAAVQARVTAVAARHHPGRCAARLGQSQSRELVVLKAQATGQ